MPPGRLNVKQEELDEMLKEAPGPINFTVFLTMFGEKLKGEAPLGHVRNTADADIQVLQLRAAPLQVLIQKRPS